MSDDDSNDDNSSDLLDERQIEDEELADWRVLFTTLHARFKTGDFDTGLKLVKKIGKAADKADHHPDIDLAYSQVDVRLTSHDADGVTSRDVDMARQISKIADDLDVESASDELSVVELALDVPAYDDVKEFWAAALGYESSEDHPEELADPSGSRPTLWFQLSDSADGDAPQRFHVDIRVPHGVAEDRVRKILDAGGTLVTDEEAPSVWVLADKHGNKACVTTWLGRVPDDVVSRGDAAGKIDTGDGDQGGGKDKDQSGGKGEDDEAPPS